MSALKFGRRDTFSQNITVIEPIKTSQINKLSTFSLKIGFIDSYIFYGLICIA